MTTTLSNATQNADGVARPTRALLVTIMQAAEILSVSRSSIYQLIWTDQLVPIRIGRSVRLSIDQLEQFIADRRTDASRRTPTTR